MAHKHIHKNILSLPSLPLSFPPSLPIYTQIQSSKMVMLSLSITCELWVSFPWSQDWSQCLGAEASDPPFTRCDWLDTDNFKNLKTTPLIITDDLHLSIWFYSGSCHALLVHLPLSFCSELHPFVGVRSRQHGTDQLSMRTASQWVGLRTTLQWTLPWLWLL